MNAILKTLQAILFTYGEPLTAEKLARFAGISKDEVGTRIGELNTALGDTPFTIVTHENAYQLATRPEYAPIIEATLKEEMTEELTPAAQETLAIIAYLGPVPRIKIDYIRGVNSSFILRNLLLRGLVDRAPDPERGNAFLYSVSFAMLRHLGITNRADLPEFERYRTLLTKVEPAASE
jgi:segregation and condensation protein B